MYGKILGNILKDLTRGKRDNRPHGFGHSLLAPCINALALNTMLRINKALKSYKDAVKAIHDGQVKLKEIKK